MLAGSREERTRLFSLMLGDRKGGKGHQKCILEIQEIQFEYRKKDFHCKDHQTVAQGAKRGWRTSILEDIQTPAEHSWSWVTCFRWLGSEKGQEPDDFQGSLPISKVCKSVIQVRLPLCQEYFLFWALELWCSKFFKLCCLYWEQCGVE